MEPFLYQVAQQIEKQVEAFEPEIACYARYALTSQGKQLRPALVALSGKAIGALHEHHVTVAAIIEMVHLATLVHDDIMDEASMRRRRPTLAAHWGNEISVLLGDCLFAHALQLAAGFPTPEICRAVAAATKTVCTGEILQTHRRRHVPLSREDYFKMVAMKTAELFALSCDLGARLSGASPGERQGLRDYGQALGTAYQIYDDCVDLFGSEATAGKSLGTDLAKGKLTLPVLIVLERARNDERERLQEMIAGWQARFLPELLGLLGEHEALEESQRVIQEQLTHARAALKPLLQARNPSGLQRLIDLLAQQAAELGARE